MDSRNKPSLTECTNFCHVSPSKRHGHDRLSAFGTMNTPYYLIATALLLLGSWNTAVFGQVECSAPGNLRGIRTDGELMAFTTSIHAVLPAAAEENQGGRSRDGGQFSREGDIVTVTGSLVGGAGRRRGPGGGGFFRGETPAAGVSYRAGFKLIAPGTVEAGIEITSTTNTSHAGGVLCPRAAGGRLCRRLGSMDRTQPGGRCPDNPDHQPFLRDQLFPAHFGQRRAGGFSTTAD